MTTNQDMSHFALMHHRNDEEEEEGDDTGLGSNTQYQQQLTEAMMPKQATNGAKILSFKNVCSVQSQPSNLNVLYSTGKVLSTKSASARYIPPRPENVLDAPVVLDDYYLHTLDWSSNNIIAAALGSDVYLWNATTATITLLMTAAEGDYISCVSWITDGSVLAVGLSDGAVQLWDVNLTKLVRTMTGHSARVGCLDWNSHILSSGSRSGAIHHHDVRVASHHVGTLDHHTQEVCGLRWSPDGAFLASGANDNTVHIWDTSLGLEVAPLHTFTEHQAAVKAVSWCPWQTRLLATGGGTSDRHIRFWNTNSGTCIKAVDTKSQVCSVLWSKEHRELVSGHGYSMNQLSLWKYPTMNKITDLVGHSGRILNLCMSPDGQIVASIAADETIRLWKCFAQDKKKKPSKPATTTGSTSGLSMCIR
ncbi:cell division cycle protein 20 homolog [Babylonia areolata]|uniref:cell division cycle protein 20 homolog n=1 Tax=Babylonia areolata TaxID=304850 RepID=UPI003FD25D09